MWRLWGWALADCIEKLSGLGEPVALEHGATPSCRLPGLLSFRKLGHAGAKIQPPCCAWGAWKQRILCGPSALFVIGHQGSSVSAHAGGLGP